MPISGGVQIAAVTCPGSWLVSCTDRTARTCSPSKARRRSPRPVFGPVDRRHPWQR